MQKIPLSPPLAANRTQSCGGIKGLFPKMMKDGLLIVLTFRQVRSCNQLLINDCTIGAIVLNVCRAFIPYNVSLGCTQSESMDFQLGSVCM